MIILNIFIAVIIAIGFWRKTSKEHKRKIAKASRTKTVIFFLLSAAVTFFYYKSYQVATIKNYIVVKAIKGNYNNGYSVYEIIDKKTNQKKEIKEEKIYPNDTIKYLTILNKFTHNDLDLSNPLSVMWDSVNYSGIYYKIKLGDSKNTKWYPKISKKDFFNNYKDSTHIYSFFYLTNTIPNFIPFVKNARYSKSIGNMDLENYDSNSDSYSFHLKNTIDIGKKNIDNGFRTYLIFNDTMNYHEYKGRISSSSINTLNFFSAADLSQCEYEVNIESEIPIDTFCMNFDLPIEISSLDVIRHHINSRGFKLGVVNKKRDVEKTTFVKPFLIKFPTLANLQLIRSLILTTLLTALLSLFFKNLYYYVRKIYERRKRKQKLPFTYSRKIVLLWIPVGKIIVWTFILIFAFLLFLSVRNYHFRINSESVPNIILTICISILLYILLIGGLFNYLYKKGIIIRDVIDMVKCRIKLFKGRIKVQTDKIFYKIKDSVKVKKDVKPSPDSEEQPEETSNKMEDNISNEIINQENGPNSPRQPSRPQKHKSQKRSRRK